MRLFHGIRTRLAGEYKAKEIALCQNRAEWAEHTFASNVGKPATRDLLQRMAAAERRDIFALKARAFLGGKIAQALFGASNAYEMAATLFDNGGGEMKIGDIRLPKAIHFSEKSDYWNVLVDILFEYLLDDGAVKIADGVFNEGPYEYPEGIRLCEGDIVIDAGSNMGVFSALAGIKGCKVYAFEPIRYFIDNFLSKTASWNGDITICPYALHDENTKIVFELGVNDVDPCRGIADALMIVRRRLLRYKAKQEVSAVTLDSFVEDNKLPRVDFIKADIEGVERNMLKGAKETIRRFSPKISICTYHLLDDPEVLGGMLREFQPKYKIIEKYKKMYAYVEGRG